MTGVLNRNGINQNMIIDHRYFHLEHSSKFGFLNLRKSPILMSHGKNQCWPSEIFADPNQWQYPVTMMELYLFMSSQSLAKSMYVFIFIELNYR